MDVDADNLGLPGSERIDIINELPIAMECEFIEYQNDETGIGVIGKVGKTSIEEANMSGDKVNIDSLEAIAFDPYALKSTITRLRCQECY